MPPVVRCPWIDMLRCVDVYLPNSIVYIITWNARPPACKLYKTRRLICYGAQMYAYPNQLVEIFYSWFLITVRVHPGFGYIFEKEPQLWPISVHVNYLLINMLWCVDQYLTNFDCSWKTHQSEWYDQWWQITLYHFILIECLSHDIQYLPCIRIYTKWGILTCRFYSWILIMVIVHPQATFLKCKLSYHVYHCILATHELICYCAQMDI